MRINFKLYAWVLAIVMGGGIAGGIVRLAEAPALYAQERDDDYAKNRNYQQGVRDGREDRAHNRDHYKKRHFKKDEDQKAYEAGYQHGHEHDEHHDQQR